MENKTADQIQAEMELMRLAYRERCEQIDRTPLPPWVAAAPFLISAAITLMLITVFILFFS